MVEHEGTGLASPPRRLVLGAVVDDENVSVELGVHRSNDVAHRGLFVQGRDDHEQFAHCTATLGVCDRLAREPPGRRECTRPSHQPGKQLADRPAQDNVGQVIHLRGLRVEDHDAGPVVLGEGNDVGDGVHAERGADSEHQFAGARRRRQPGRGRPRSATGRTRSWPLSRCRRRCDRAGRPPLPAPVRGHAPSARGRRTTGTPPPVCARAPRSGERGRCPPCGATRRCSA